MSACTENAEPQIAILMAVYEPRLDWLREQLLSLDAQRYPHLKLYIRDDGSSAASFESLRRCVAECIRVLPAELRRNERNLGSNRTFELLTQEAEGDYFAYCDQDDIWLPDKLSALSEAMTAGIHMAYSDMRVINAAGQPLADSLTELRPRLHYLQGRGLAESYFFRNCTAGCSMLIRAETAKAALPFPEQTVCDHWLALIAAVRGGVAFVETPLLSYRQHDHNQTGILSGVNTKADYSSKRLLPLAERLEFYQKYAHPSVKLERFVEARLRRKPWGIWRYRRFSPQEALFEIAMKGMPEALFRRVIRRIK